MVDPSRGTFLDNLFLTSRVSRVKQSVFFGFSSWKDFCLNKEISRDRKDHVTIC